MTNLNVYNINETKIKKAISIKYIRGLSKSTNKTNGGFLMHMTNRHDYRFKCEKEDMRNKLFERLKKVWFKTH